MRDDKSDASPLDGAAGTVSQAAQTAGQIQKTVNQARQGAGAAQKAAHTSQAAYVATASAQGGAAAAGATTGTALAGPLGTVVGVIVTSKTFWKVVGGILMAIFLWMFIIARIANNMLGSDIDFIIRDLDEQSRSVVASRKDAMLKKRQMFYFNENEEEKPMLYPGRIVEARVIAVAPKVVRLEVFGVEVSVRARDMAWEWMVDASEKFQVGDLTLVMVNQINIRSVEEMEISVDAKSATANVNKDNLKRCVRQGKYVGIITDVYKGTYFIRLNIGVNAVAHSCNMASLPSKRDEVGFVVTRINDKFEVAEGIITRMIKRGA